jgi:hypothetical protein
MRWRQFIVISTWPWSGKDVALDLVAAIKKHWVPAHQPLYSILRESAARKILEAHNLDENGNFKGSKEE